MNIDMFIPGSEFLVKFFALLIVAAIYGCFFVYYIQWALKEWDTSSKFKKWIICSVGFFCVSSVIGWFR